MLKFQPPGFGQRAIATSLGVMAYYTPVAFPWRWPEDPEEKPPLIFLHSLGGGSSAYEWSKVYSAFASDYQAIAPDLVGWGQSAHPERDYRVEDYLTLLAELIEAVGEPPATVFASSLTESTFAYRYWSMGNALLLFAVLLAQPAARQKAKLQAS